MHISSADWRRLAAAKRPPVLAGAHRVPAALLRQPCGAAWCSRGAASSYSSLLQHRSQASNHPTAWSPTPLLQVCLDALAEQPPSRMLSEKEERAHFALWAVLKSPLMIAADLRRWA